MQPLRFAADAQAGLVHVLDRRLGHETAHRFGKPLQARRASPAHALKRCASGPDPEHIVRERDETFLRQQLLVQQIDRDGGDQRAILHRCVDALGKHATCSPIESRALANMCAMLGDDERTRFGQVVHLTRRVIARHAGRQRATTSRTDQRKIIEDHVGFGGLPQGLALVAFLPARLFAGGLAQARHPRRLLQPVTRRRLALLELLKPSRRSSSATRATSVAICAACACMSAISFLRDGASTASATIRFLNRRAIPTSRKIRSNIEAAEKNQVSYPEWNKII